METKPKTHRCLACGAEWSKDQLMQSPSHTAIVLTCGDVFCGGAVVPIKEPK